MAQKLKNIELTSVDLVRRGANQKADICLYKSLAGAPAEDPRSEALAATRTISKSDPLRFDYIEEYDP